MKEAAEHEKVLFLKTSDGSVRIKSPNKERPTEVKYDLSKNYKKRLRIRGKTKLILFTIFDHLLVVTVVIVNVVGFWRGLFGIFSQFRDLYHQIFLYLLGSTVICHFTVAKNAYKRHLINNNVGCSILRKAYTYVFGCSCIAQWAGLWFFLDGLSGFDVYPPLAYSLICSGILISIKLYRNVLAPPVTFCTDRVEDFFEFPTIFSLSPPKQVAAGTKALRMRSRNSGTDSNPSGYKRFLSVVDTVLSNVVIAPAVIAYWRGTWYLSDFYVFPQNLKLNLIVSTVVGALVQLIFSLWQDGLEKAFRPDKHRIIYYVASRLYTHIYSIACVNLWRGGWKALDFYSGTDPVQVVVPTAVSLVVLVGMKTMRNLSSAPLAVILDRPNGYFQVLTMFKLRGTSDTSLYVLDCFFSVFVIGTLIVFVWRGVWCLTDVFLYPENEMFSALASLAIGYAIVIVVFSIQVPMKSLCEKVTGFWRLLVADVYIFIAFIGTINLWRGIWNLLNIYFLPESPILSCWITHLGSFAFLVLINCSNSTLVRGVYLDGEDGGKCVSFPISYLRIIFKKNLNENVKNEENHKKSSLTNVCMDVESNQKDNPENGKGIIE